MGRFVLTPHPRPSPVNPVSRDGQHNTRPGGTAGQPGDQTPAQPTPYISKAAHTHAEYARAPRNAGTTVN